MEPFFPLELVWMQSVGQQLKNARELQGKSLEDVGSELKIRADHVAALEEGDFSKFDAGICCNVIYRFCCKRTTTRSNEFWVPFI